MNWNDLTEITNNSAVNFYPAQEFSKQWKKNWQQKKLLWLPFISSCCALEANISEYMSGPRFENADQDGFLKPNHTLTEKGPMVVIFSGTLTHRLISRLHQLKENIGDSYVCMMLGGCALGQGPYQNYINVLNGDAMPLRVDVFVPGCPPTVEAINEGMNLLDKKLDILMDSLASKVKQ